MGIGNGNYSRIWSYFFKSNPVYINQKLLEFDSFLEKDTKRSIPLDPNFQKLLIEADESQEFEPEFPYRQIVGSLMYAAIGTRFDISTAVGIASRFLENPKQIHCEMVRQILYYLRQNPTSPLSFKKSKDPKLEIYCDSSFANTEDYASISGFAVLFGGSLLSWSIAKSNRLLPCLQQRLNTYSCYRGKSRSFVVQINVKRNRNRSTNCHYP